MLLWDHFIGAFKRHAGFVRIGGRALPKETIGGQSAFYESLPTKTFTIVSLKFGTF